MRGGLLRLTSITCRRTVGRTAALTDVTNRQPHRSNTDYADLRGEVGVDKVVHQRVVARVALLQGEKQLAVLLGVPSSHVARWVEGLAPVPTDVFLRCCDYLAEHDQPPADESEKTN
jgi:hypothetical protein